MLVTLFCLPQSLGELLSPSPSVLVLLEQLLIHKVYSFPNIIKNNHCFPLSTFVVSDFELSKSTLRFNSAKTQDNIVVEIIDDDVIESTENFAISLTNPNPPDAVARLGSTRITIINNDYRKFH